MEEKKEKAAVRGRRFPQKWDFPRRHTGNPANLPIGKCWPARPVIGSRPVLNKKKERGCIRAFNLWTTAKRPSPVLPCLLLRPCMDGRELSGGRAALIDAPRAGAPPVTAAGDQHAQLLSDAGHRAAPDDPEPASSSLVGETNHKCRGSNTVAPALPQLNNYLPVRNCLNGRGDRTFTRRPFALSLSRALFYRCLSLSARLLRRFPRCPP